MTHVWDNAPFKGATLMTLLALADSANDEGWCWPSMKTLTEKTRQSERAVYDSIAALCDDGWLLKTMRDGNKKVLYRVIFAPASGAGGFQLTAPDAENTARGAVNTARGANPPDPLIGRTVRNRKEPLSKRSASGRKFSDEQIEKIYKAYPRQEGKRAALTAIEKALGRIEVEPGEDPVESLEAIVQEFAATPKGKAGQFCPMPATWFNDSRYMDDPKVWQRS